MKENGNSKLVYTSEEGRICPDCEKPVDSCICKKAKQQQQSGDGIIRIRRETKGRNGKTVTTVSGITGNIEAIKELSAKIKKACGAGGMLKDGIIEIQGDHREFIENFLKKLGYKTKLAGG
ncbi:MAG: translation initiation factor Sui1 [Candidatus Riflebacteria bacterium]|nr:translation initiation factor Sui1 [Candidatus Riflebacteria bacterium]